MFRRISYSIMVMTVFLSWGLMLRVAYVEDRSSDIGKTSAIVHVAPTYVIPDTAVTNTVASSDKNIEEELPRVIHKTVVTKTTTVK